MCAGVGSAIGCGIYFNVVPLKGSNAGRPGGSLCRVVWERRKWLLGKEEELAHLSFRNERAHAEWFESRFEVLKGGRGAFRLLWRGSGRYVRSVPLGVLRFGRLGRRLEVK